MCPSSLGLTASFLPSGEDGISFVVLVLCFGFPLGLALGGGLRGLIVLC
jgi:hypothetical protein